MIKNPYFEKAVNENAKMPEVEAAKRALGLQGVGQYAGEPQREPNLVDFLDKEISLLGSLMDEVNMLSDSMGGILRPEIPTEGDSKSLPAANSAIAGRVVANCLQLEALIAKVHDLRRRIDV
jgi:hypothetical protein